jgi:hypothetical protein
VRIAATRQQPHALGVVHFILNAEVPVQTLQLVVVVVVVVDLLLSCRAACFKHSDSLHYCCNCYLTAPVLALRITALQLLLHALRHTAEEQAAVQ